MTVFVITGPMAAGKSTVAAILAGRFPRAAHVRGDTFRRSIVSGGEEMSPEPSDEALRQLELRYRLAANAADAYAAAGFTAIVQDNILGPWLERFVAMLQAPAVHVVVLDPSPEAIAAREESRPKTGYGDWPIADFVAGFRASTPRIGLWLDTSAQTPEETVEAILTRLDEARVR